MYAETGWSTQVSLLYRSERRQRPMHVYLKKKSHIIIPLTPALHPTLSLPSLHHLHLSLQSI